MATICDIHCHFFSARFLEILVASNRQSLPAAEHASVIAGLLGWDPPGTPEDLADRWVRELDTQGVSRAALIASIPGDEDSVAIAVARHPSRFVGFFMFDPTPPDAKARLARALGELKLHGVALFPAMHKYRLDDDRVEAVFSGAEEHRAVVFAHCGILTVGVRRKLGLASPFDLRLGDPLSLSTMAARYPRVPVIIPHFGAGFMRKALIAADQCPNIHLDTSSSNSWMKFYPGLTLDAVYRQAVQIAGVDRVLFGTDSSFFPRGWQRGILDTQLEAMAQAGLGADAQARVLSGNFDRLFPHTS
jgi:predicted TIM-barrel fold metal-dependent hydrolase